VELGYGWDYFNLGTLPGLVKQVTGVRIQQQVYLNNFNARFQLIKENDLAKNGYQQSPLELLTNTTVGFRD